MDLTLRQPLQKPEEELSNQAFLLFDRTPTGEAEELYEGEVPYDFVRGRVFQPYLKYLDTTSLDFTENAKKHAHITGESFADTFFGLTDLFFNQKTKLPRIHPFKMSATDDYIWRGNKIVLHTHHTVLDFNFKDLFRGPRFESNMYTKARFFSPGPHLQHVIAFGANLSEQDYTLMRNEGVRDIIEEPVETPEEALRHIDNFIANGYNIVKYKTRWR